MTAGRPSKQAGGPHLSEVARVVLVEVDALVVLSAGVTAATRMLPVLPHAPVSGADVTALLAVVLQLRILWGRLLRYIRYKCD